MSLEEMQRMSQLQNIVTNEEIWRRMPASHRELAQRAAQFLTPPQLAVLERMHTEQMNGLQQLIERARLQAGLNPAIPERSDIQMPVSRPTRTPIVGNVKVEFTVAVNRGEATRVSHVGPNGEPVTFAAGDGLFIEATPTLYDDHWLDVRTNYYEEAEVGQRRLLGSGAFGTLTRMPDGTPSRGGSGGGVITGSKGYAITETATAEAL
jgi:hypothetical protein